MSWCSISATCDLESVVHRHLEDQPRYLDERDLDLKILMASIQSAELAHLHEARACRGATGPVQQGAVPDMLIRLSTRSDSSRVAREMRSVVD